MKEVIVEMKVVMMMMMGFSLKLLFNFFNNFLGHSLNAVEEIWMGGASLFFRVKLVPWGSQFLGSGQGSWVFGCVQCITCPYLVLLRLGFGSSQLQSVCPPLHQCHALTICSIIFAIFTLCFFFVIFSIISVIFTIFSIILTICSIILAISTICSIILTICSIMLAIFTICFILVICSNIFAISTICSIILAIFTIC